MDVLEKLKFLGKFTKKKFWGGVAGSGGGGVQGECVRRIEVFGENSKKKLGGEVWVGGGSG